MWTIRYKLTGQIIVKYPKAAQCYVTPAFSPLLFYHFTQISLQPLLIYVQTKKAEFHLTF
jgi:hypothetical protein